MARKTVKVSAVLDVNLHSRLCVAASLRGMTKNAILTDALTSYLKGIVAFDRGRKSDHGKKDDRLELREDVNSAVADTAA